MKIIKNIGKYFFLLKKIFKVHSKKKIFIKMILGEIDNLGSNSLGIVSFISLFMGAVVSIQMYNNIKDSIIPIPKYYIGHATKMVLLLEFCPTITSIILAGKIGSFISSSIGIMRITEQIDALEMMGINSASFLILPKIIACIIFNPILIMISFLLGITGGWLSGEITGGWISNEYIYGIQMQNLYIFYWYCIIKSIIFAFIIVTIPSYFGYFINVGGGSVEIGKATTSSVVWTCIIIIIFDLIITQIMLC